jgi:hypothetical protein
MSTSIYPKDFFRSSDITPAHGQCFVLMPFDKKFDVVYDIIKQTIEGSEFNMRCLRADNLTGGGFIIQGIMLSIAESEFIIADLTDRNSNVFYELGIVHMAKDIKKVIILTQDMDFVPFDLRQFRCIVYQQNQLSLRLTEAFRELTKEQFRCTIPKYTRVRIPQKFWGEDDYPYELEFYMPYIESSNAKGEMYVFKLRSNGEREQISFHSIGLSLMAVRELKEFNLPLRYELRLERVVNESAIVLITKSETNRTAKQAATQEPESESSAQIEGLKQYKSRSELPPFDKMLSIANTTVDMSGLDFRKVVHEFMTIIRQLIYKNIRITFLLLDPNSEQVKIQSKNFHAVEDLKESLQKSIRLLCEEREKLPPYMRGNLIIRLYNYPPEHGIIIVDEGHENAWIKVEARPLGSDSNSRPSDAWYKRYDPSRYSQYMQEYNTLFHNSKEYRCPTS